MQAVPITSKVVSSNFKVWFRQVSLYIQINIDKSHIISTLLSTYIQTGGWVMAFNVTFNNISVILLQSVLFVEETGENKSLTNFIT
jgi:hypothetical protein